MLRGVVSRLDARSRPADPFCLTVAIVANSFAFLTLSCVRRCSSTVEHLICNQVVASSILAIGLVGTHPWEERFPSGQREQTVNLPAYAFGGSNPPLSTSMIVSSMGRAGIAQLVEREPSKLGVAGSNPVSRSKPGQTSPGGMLRRQGDAHVAQSVEHFLGKEEVMGSIPVVGLHTSGAAGAA